MSKLLPVGAQTYSKAPGRFPAGTPQRAGEAKGAWVTCSDGRTYVDTINGLGAVILGHRGWMTSSHPALPLPTLYERDAATALTDCLSWPGAESVRFAKNGADVTGAAVRLARAVTGRDHLVYTGYHGHHDWSMCEPPMNAGVPEAVRALSHRVPFNDFDAAYTLISSGAVAAFVSEPWPTAEPRNPPSPHYWTAIRRACDEHGVLLVLDEMVTGFRLAVGGGAGVYGIRPDIACYGKALGNGHSVSAIVTRWQLAQHWEQDVFFSTTHGAEQTGIAAAIETLREVRAKNVPERLAELGREILALPGTCGYPQRPILEGWSPEALSALVTEHRILTQGYVNISLAMCDDTEARAQLMEGLRATAPAEVAA